MGIFCGIFSGCGGSPEELLPTVPVKGTVLYRGSPVTEGNITFHPVDPLANPAVSPIDANGQFELTTYQQHDGAAAGFHQVTVMVAPRLDGMPASTPADRIPEVYHRPETSPLSLEVKAGETNQFEVVLEDQ